MRAKIDLFLDTLIIYLLFIFMICEHHIKFTAIKNISLYLALFCAFFFYFFRREYALRNIKFNFSLTKNIITPIIIFVIYGLLVSLFPYDDRFGSISEISGEFGRGLAFLFIVYVWCDGSEKKVRFFFYSILVAFLFITIYYSNMLFVDIDNFKSTDHNIGRIIKRSYADYVDRFMIFLLVGFVIFKNKFIKFALGTLFFLAIIMEILSGVRGSWLNLIICITMFMAFLYFGGHNEILRRNIKKFTIFTAIFGIIFLFLASNSTMVGYKISQGLDSSGRYLILKERLPLFLGSKRAFIGLGYGKEQYDEFLRDEMDNGAKISMMQTRDGGKRYWFNDEPFFIGNFYYYGIGLAAFIWAFVGLLTGSFRGFKRSGDLMFVAIFISIFGYFGVRGLFETINLKILYLFYMAGFFTIVSAFHAKFKGAAK